VTLGLAERAMAAKRPQEAIGFFNNAVYGNLLGLRRPGRVALAATDAAEMLADSDGVLRFLNEAAKDPETRVEALRRLAQFSFVTKDVAKARSVLRGLAEALDGSERAEVLAQLARALFESTAPSERLEADRTLREAIDAAPPELAERLREQLGTFRSRPPPSSNKPAQLPQKPPPPRSALHEPAPRAIAVIGQIPTAPPVMNIKPEEELVASVRHPPLGAEPGARSAEGEHSGGWGKKELGARSAERAEPPHDPASDPPPPDMGVSSRPPAPLSDAGGAVETRVSSTAPLDPRAVHVAQARDRIAAGAQDEGERMLSDLLRAGSIAAADELDRVLSADPARGASLLKVRRQAVELCPGDMRRLVALRDAARLDKNPNYVRAIEHVLRAFDPQSTPVNPPPLSAQQTQPGMLTLLTRHSREIGGEAFATVWEGASGVFAKQANAYRMTGLERVAPGPMWTLSRLYEVALRLLDTPRFALFHRRGSGPLTLTVALLQTPSAILGGEAREDGPDVRYILGHALASVLPQNVLPLGLPESEGRILWEVLLGTFGPPARTKMDKTHANLAEILWQTLSPRAQRRLKELLGNDDPTPFELVVERANQSGRRVGMFLTGDFAHAARTLLNEHPAVDGAELSRPGGLLKLCGELPALADLYRLAVRPEYADARWHLPSPQSQRFPFAAGGLPPV
jgi:hypothetical protein